MSQEEKSKGGRPPYIPTDEQRKLVAELAGLGLPQPQIAALVGCNDDTLRLRYRTELDMGMAQANAEVIRHLFQHTKTAPAAAIFWAKCRLRWRETSDENETDKTITIVGGLPDAEQ